MKDTTVKYKILLNTILYNIKRFVFYIVNLSAGKLIDNNIIELFKIRTRSIKSTHLTEKRFNCLSLKKKVK